MLIPQVNIKCTNGDKFAISTQKSGTVLDLKNAVEVSATIPAAQQRLIFKGNVLKDERTLESYSIEDGQTIILVRGSKGCDGPTPAVATTAPVSSASTAPASAAPPPSAAPGGAPPVANPFAAMFGGGAAPNPFGGGAGANPFAAMFGGGPGAGGNFQQMMQQAQQQMVRILSTIE